MRIPDRLARLLRGRAEDPAWARPSLLAATALLYLWSLSASGWANDFYSAAAQAASQSWKAFFFGSSDASNFITVDKPPAALWVMGLSARLFGVNSWSLLAPQALGVVPAFALVYLAAAPGSLGRRLGQLVAAGAAMVASAGWWVAIVELLPAAARAAAGARPAGPACSGPRSAARSPGCSRRPWSCWPPGCG